MRQKNQALSLAEVEVFRFVAKNNVTTQASKPVQLLNYTPVKDKTLTIQHSGAYIARYSISWEEVTVDKKWPISCPKSFLGREWTQSDRRLYPQSPN